MKKTICDESAACSISKQRSEDASCVLWDSDVPPCFSDVGELKLYYWGKRDTPHRDGSICWFRTWRERIMNLEVCKEVSSDLGLFWPFLLQKHALIILYSVTHLPARGTLRVGWEMLPFGGHRHGSSWINESFRAGLSESLCIMSPCVARQDDRHRTQDMKVAWAKTQISGGILRRRWQMSWAAGRQLSAPCRAYACVIQVWEILEMGWCMKGRRGQRHCSYFESLRYTFDDAYWELCDFGRP